MEPITMYTTPFCIDCRRAKNFLRDRGVAYNEVNIEGDDEAEALVIEVNDGKRSVPTLKVGERYFSCSPFNPLKLANELGIPLNR